MEDTTTLARNERPISEGSTMFMLIHKKNIVTHAIFLTLSLQIVIYMPHSVDPKQTTRAFAYVFWMKAPNPMVTFI